MGNSKIGRSALMAGDPWLGSTTYSILHGMKSLGWDVLNINPTNYIKTSGSISMKIVNRLTHQLSVDEYNVNVIRMLKVTKPDVFIVVKGNYLKSETIEEIRYMGIITVNYYPDVHFSFRTLDRKSIVNYDHIFTTKSYHVDYLVATANTSSVHYLPHGYSDDFHMPPVRTANKETDILYVGTYNAEKKEWLEEVKKHFPSLKLTIYGGSWRENTKNSNLAESVVGSPIFGYKYCEIINSCKINLAIHMGATDTSGWKDLVSTRTFEIPACKGFMLHVDNMEVREFFEPKKEIDVFSNPEELFEKIELYIGNNKLRDNMVESAYRRCVPAYGYNQRAKVISECILKSI